MNTTKNGFFFGVTGGLVCERRLIVCSWNEHEWMLACGMLMMILTKTKHLVTELCPWWILSVRCLSWLQCWENKMERRYDMIAHDYYKILLDEEEPVIDWYVVGMWWNERTGCRILSLGCRAAGFGKKKTNRHSQLCQQQQEESWMLLP